MGVPKFYRWISERYPCLSQVVTDYQIPEFDNFYLDMNGIIHMCSHPNDDDPTFRMPEDKIFTEIFRYIEALFRMIKPRKVLFLAVDGVAPRAKMNQQRGRRFRSAREAQDVVRKALQKGLILPSEPRFDSNCITPGTEFMARLHEQLKYFVNQKVATDPSWQSVEVILSGQEVPGEGEHKIMDYIRHQKAQPDYDHNTRHCLYGLDADLIMLGLVTHEPHFCLLREEVRFGKKNQKRNTSPSAVTFHLLHLTILREYIEHEFSSLRTGLSFPYDLESILDDWVLLGFLVGNDFLPNLPNMHIKQNVLPYLYKKYMEVLPKLDGYINEGGTLNMRRFEFFLRAVAEFDYDFYSELISDMKWLDAKKAGSKRNNKRTPLQAQEGKADKGHLVDVESAGEEGGGEGERRVTERELVGFFSGREEDMSTDDLDSGSEMTEKLKRDLGIPSLNAYFEKEDADRIDSFEADLAEMKARYYQEKMGFNRISPSVLLEQAKCFVVGIQWVLSYYYHGVPSWSWFYPYHYAPFVSDVKGFGNLQLEFELGKPFLPFEQLLGVLPPASKTLLPTPFQGLMVNDDSPIKDYYPVEFRTDLNGKEQEWEAVVLIPFIDEERLLAAMREKQNQLTKEEVKRNAHGTCQLYSFDPDMEPFTYPSPWPQVFPDVAQCTVSCRELPPVPFPITHDSLVPGLLQGVKLDIFFPGFPTLKHVTHTAQLERRGVRVFQAASRDANTCLAVQKKSRANKDLQSLADEMVGKHCYVGWPYLTESKIHSISDGVVEFRADPLSRSKVKLIKHTLKEKEIVQWNADVTQVTRHYAEFRGIDIPPIDVLVYAKILQGKRYIPDKDNRGTLILHKEWKSIAEPHPYDLTITDITAHAPEYREKGMTLEELFKPREHCFMLANPHYGFQAEIMSVDPAQVRVQVKVRLLPEPDIATVVGNSHRLSLHYLPSYIVCQQVGLKPLVLSRIAGNVQVERGSPDNVKERERINIGLNLKFDKRNKEMPGYCRRTGEGWAYSPAAVELIQSFMTEFPTIFSYLQDKPKEDKYYESDLMPANTADGVTLAMVQEWLKKLPVSSMETVDCGGQSLDEPQIAAVEKAVSDMKKMKMKSVKVAKLRVKPSVLFVPSIHQGAVVPDPKAEYFLYDRVINVMPNSVVPFGLKGTVIGIRGDNKEVALLYEVLCDEEFLGGLTLRCSPNRAYCLPPSSLLNLSHGARMKAERSRQQQQPMTTTQLRQQSYVGGLGGNILGSRGSYSGVVMDGSPSGRGGHNSFSRAVPNRQHGPPYMEVGQYHSTHDFTRGRAVAVRGRERPEQAQRGAGSSSGSWREDGSWRERGRERPEQAQRGVGSSSGSWREDGSSGGSRGSWRERGGERGGRGGTWRGRERETPTRVLVRNQRSTVSPNQSGLLNDVKSKRQSQSPSKQLQQKRPNRHPWEQNYNSVESKKDDDTFAAALSALEKLEVAPSGSNKDLESGDKDFRSREKELSPSVAAMFNSIEAAASSSNNRPVASAEKPAKQGLSPTLKAMLKMEEERPPSEPEKNQDPEGAVKVPDAMIQKLMHHPRGPLLPHPGLLPFQPAMQSHFTPPHSQLLHQTRPHHFYPPHSRGVAPDYSSPPLPPFMPFGPPPMDPFTALQQTCYMTGQPPPQVTVRKNEQGYYVGVVSVGKMKCSGVPCLTQEEAKTSAAASMNSTLAPFPMYFAPMPYMQPPVGHGGYGGPPPIPPHVPQYHHSVPFAYHPRGPQPQPMLPQPPSFVPLQVQQRQGRNVGQKFQKKSTHLPTAAEAYSQQLGPAKTNNEGAKQEKPVKQELQVNSSPTCITDDEKAKEKAEKGLQTVENEKVTFSEVDESMESTTQELQGEEELKALASASTKVEELYERYGMAEKESVETQKKISRLKQTLSVLKDPAAQAKATSEGLSEDESKMADAVAKAAIVSALEDDIEDPDSTYFVPVQTSDSTTPPSEGVCVVGEILGGEGSLDNLAPQADDFAAGNQGSTNVTPQVDDVTTTEQQQPVPRPTELGQTMPEGSSTESSPPSAPVSTVPGTAVKSGRPKRQLAASFVRGTS